MGGNFILRSKVKFFIIYQFGRNTLREYHFAHLIWHGDASILEGTFCQSSDGRFDLEVNVFFAIDPKIYPRVNYGCTQRIYQR